MPSSYLSGNNGLAVTDFSAEMTIRPFSLSWGQQATFWIGVQSGSHHGIVQPVIGFYHGVGGSHLAGHGWAHLVSDNGTSTYEGGHLFQSDNPDFHSAVETPDASNGQTVRVTMSLSSQQNQNGSWSVTMRIAFGGHNIERTATVDFAPTTAMIYAEKDQNIHVDADVKVLTLQFGAQTGETVLAGAGQPFVVGNTYHLS